MSSRVQKIASTVLAMAAAAGMMVKAQTPQVVPAPPVHRVTLPLSVSTTMPFVTESSSMTLPGVMPSGNFQRMTSSALSESVRGVTSSFATRDVNYRSGQVFERNPYGTGMPDQRAFSNRIVGDGAQTVVSAHWGPLHPALTMGGGAINDSARGVKSEMLSAAGEEAGLDLAIVDHRFGLRVEGRTLAYRGTFSSSPFVSTDRWVATRSPSFGAYVHF